MYKYITDLNQYAIEFVIYSLVLVEYFYAFIVNMLLERNVFDSIAFFSQCSLFEPVSKIEIGNIFYELSGALKRSAKILKLVIRCTPELLTIFFVRKSNIPCFIYFFDPRIKLRNMQEIICK